MHIDQSLGAATARRVQDLTRAVLTVALTGLAADAPLAGDSEKGSTRKVAASRRVRR
jgi:hypothetical protein